MGKSKSRSARRHRRTKIEDRHVRRVCRMLSPEVRFHIATGLHHDLIEAARRTEQRYTRAGVWSIALMEQIDEYRLTGVANHETISAMECARASVAAPLMALAEDLNRFVGNPVYGVSSSIDWEAGRNPRIVVEVGRYQSIGREGRSLYLPPREGELGPVCYSKHFLLQWSERVLGGDYKGRAFGWLLGHAPLLPGKSVEYRLISDVPGLLAVLVPYPSGILMDPGPTPPGSLEALVDLPGGLAPYVTLGDGTRVLTTFLPFGASRTPGSEGRLEGEAWEEVLPRTRYSSRLPDDRRDIWDYSRLLPSRTRQSKATPHREAPPS